MRGEGRHSREAFTLIEAALVVCILGVVLAVFIPTFLEHLRTSKIAEAPEQLERLHRATAAYWDARHETGAGLGTRCLPEQAGPAPAEPSAEPREVDFAAPDTAGAATWKALGFAPDRPVRYRYYLQPAESGCNLTGSEGDPLVTFRAEGDLDDDGTLSTFERSAAVADDGTLEPAGILYVVDRVE